MNYKRIYDNIINDRLNNPLDENEYGEKHHIIPRSLGGSDSNDNLVRLTAREHFICHALLAEMYEEGSNEWYKMNHAFMMMRLISDNQIRYINSRLYEYKRKDFTKVMSRCQSGEKNSQYNTTWVYHPIKEKSIRINTSDLENYESKGWNQGRVINFKKYHDKQEKKNDFIRKKEKYFNEKKKYYTELYNEFISSDCKSLREFNRMKKFTTVVGRLSNNFKKYVDGYSAKQRVPYKNKS